MRTLVIGDIHGCDVAFKNLLASMEARPDDCLITLGDYIDRGPDSRGVLDRLIALHRQGNVISLLGNHESMLLDSRYDSEIGETWRMVGGAETLASYAPPGRRGELSDIPSEHWQFIETRCRRYWQNESHIFVHAGLDPDLPLEDQTDDMLLWERFGHAAPHCSGKVWICGHSRQRNGRPANLGFALCLDTSVYADGWLSGLDVERGWIWQANQAGQTREFGLSEASPINSR